RQLAEDFNKRRLEIHLPSGTRRQPDGRKRPRHAAAKTRRDPALAADHLQMMGHHLDRPRGRRVQTMEIRLGREGFVALKFVEHEKTLRLKSARPTRSTAKPGNAQAFRKMFMGMPITELRTLLGANFPPHRDGRLTEQC